MACENPCDCPEDKFDGLAAPTNNDDGCNTSGNGTFCPGSMWRDTSTSPNTWWINVANDCTTAQWETIAGREALTHWKGAVIAPNLPQSVVEADFTTALDVDELYNANPGDTWDNVAKELTIEKTGYYMFTGRVLTVINNNAGRWTEGPYIQLLVYINGSFLIDLFALQPLEYLRNVDSQVQGNGTATAFLNAGDIIQVRVSHRLGQTVDLDDDPGSIHRNQWAIDRLPDYQPV